MAIDKVTFTATSIQVILDGKVFTSQKGSTNYEGLRKALFEEKEQEVRDLLDPAVRIADWAQGRFTIKDDRFYFDGDLLPLGLNGRIIEMAARGDDPQPFFNFWERLSLNPSARSVEQLWPFLDNYGIPITKGGYLLAYKSVTSDLKDKYTKKIDNSPGAFLSMPRNKVSDDPNTACHYGYHAGSLEYARDMYGGTNSKLVIVLIDPADVVCIPKDCSWQKMRICRYKVVGLYGGRLEEGVFDDEDLPEVEFRDETTEEALEAERTGLKAGKGTPVDSGYDEIVPPEPEKTGDNEEDKAVAKAVLYGYYGFDDLSEFDLRKENLGALRKYATHGLQIVGASKIRGGKEALVRRITRSR